METAESSTGRRSSVQTIKYGPAQSQEADLHTPARGRSPVVCLLHGGFWRMPYGRDDFGPVAQDLVRRGFAVWNMEYRRLGEPASGWPETFQDVATGLDHLEILVADGAALDLGRVIVIGHSAGGHLALWSAARGHETSLLRRPSRVQPIAAAGLAAVVDLDWAHFSNAGNGAVDELLGGSPEAEPARYAAASPIALLPLGVDQLIVHGVEDEILPVETAREYAREAVAAGDQVQYSELPYTGHMDYLEPSSEAHATLCRWLEQFGGA